VHERVSTVKWSNLSSCLSCCANVSSGTATCFASLEALLSSFNNWVWDELLRNYHLRRLDYYCYFSPYVQVHTRYQPKLFGSFRSGWGSSSLKLFTYNYCLSKWEALHPPCERYLARPTWTDRFIFTYTTNNTQLHSCTAFLTKLFHSFLFTESPARK